MAGETETGTQTQGNGTGISGKAVAKLGAGPIKPIIPQTIDEIFRLAELIKQSGIAPKGLDTPQAVTVVLLKGLEIGMAPMAALESIGVINGRACLYGDGIPALLWANQFKIKEWYEGDDKTLTAYCRITRPDGTVIEGSYSLSEARAEQLLSKTGPWTLHTRRMLKMRARGWTARDGAADLLKGFAIYDEQADMVDIMDITPAPAKLVPPPLPPAPEEAAPIEPSTIEPPLFTNEDLIKDLEEQMAVATDLDTLEEIMTGWVETAQEAFPRAERDDISFDIYTKHKKRIGAQA